MRLRSIRRPLVCAGASVLLGAVGLVLLPSTSWAENTISDVDVNGVGTAVETQILELPLGATVTLVDGSNAPVATVDEPSEGTYSMPDATTLAFTPELGFTGDATAANFEYTPSVGSPEFFTVTAHVTAPEAPAPIALTSSDAGTTTQIASPTLNEGDVVRLLDSGSPVAELVVNDEGVYDVVSGEIHFSPDLGFTGTATPVGYRVTDAYNQTGDSTYTPTVTLPEPPAPGTLATTGVGTDAQSVNISELPPGGTVTLLDGVDPTDTVTVSDQGTYTLHTFECPPSPGPTVIVAACSPSSAHITFDPVPGFVGDADPVTYQVTDSYSQSSSDTYTASVTLPGRPTPSAQSSTDTGTAVQSVTVAPPAGGRVDLRRGHLDVTSSTYGHQGTYSVNEETGEMTFTPVLGFNGTATPVVFRVYDAYGQHGTATYTATVLAPEGPVLVTKTTTGVGTATQTATTVPIPEGGSVWLVGTPSDQFPLLAPKMTSITMHQQGTYHLDRDTGVITFTPQLGFHGDATPVEFMVEDAYGQTASSTYTATVTPPGGPTAVALTSSGSRIGRVLVTLSDHGNIHLINKLSQKVTHITIPGQGVYAVDHTTGEITFTPEDGFSGTARAVVYELIDAYDQTSANTYTATVLADVVNVNPTPTGNSGTLPRTGVDVDQLGLLAGLLMGLGTALRAVARRRLGA
jgi:CshA-type fibril repeat protein